MEFKTLEMAWLGYWHVMAPSPDPTLEPHDGRLGKGLVHQRHRARQVAAAQRMNTLDQPDEALNKSPTAMMIHACTASVYLLS